ncbi:MAG: hypothetical protein NZ523_13755 [Elioraea sp.]|nr:hypothetical protein [Elioraea sp.]
MSAWLLVLLAPLVTSCFVLIAAVLGVPAPVAAVALLPLLVAGALAWLGFAIGVEAAVLAALLTAAVLAAGLAKRVRVTARAR